MPDSININLLPNLRPELRLLTSLIANFTMTTSFSNKNKRTIIANFNTTARCLTIFHYHDGKLTERSILFGLWPRFPEMLGVIYVRIWHLILRCAGYIHRWLFWPCGYDCQDCACLPDSWRKLAVKASGCVQCL